MKQRLNYAAHELIQLLPRFNHRTPLQQLPTSGIYVFFEHGQQILFQNEMADRIVRSGTHRMDRRLRTRIRNHFGNVNSLLGNKNGSVFRKHLGGALLRKEDPDDPRLACWEEQGCRCCKDFEETVSQELRDNFTFSCFRADSSEDRLKLKSGLIALFATQPLGLPSGDWLGWHTRDKKISFSGLWNIRDVDALPLTPEQFNLLERLVKTTLAEGYHR